MTEEIVAYGYKSTLADAIQKYRQSIQKVLPRGTITLERFCKLALLAEVRQPALKRCDAKSLISALMDGASLGLDLSGNLGHAYLVPYVDRKAGITRAQLIIGYRGLIYLAHRSNAVTDIWAEVVYKEDRLELSYGLHRNLVHVPKLDGDRSDSALVGAYAVAVLPGGNTHFVYLDRRKLDSIKSRSKAADTGPWVTDYAEMCKKSAVRALIKHLPISSAEAVGRAVAIEEGQEFDLPSEEAIDIEPVEPPQPERKSERLVQEMRKGKRPARSQQEETELEADHEAPPALDVEPLLQELKRMNLEHLLEEKKADTLARGGNWEHELADLCSMPAQHAATILKAWWTGKKRRQEA